MRDDLFVGNRFGGAGYEQFDKVKIVRDKIVARCEGRVERLAPSTDPVQSMVEGANSPVLLVARRAPIQSRSEGEVETGPQIARVPALSGKVM